MNPFFSFDDDEFFGDLLLMGAASGGGSVVQETATGNPLTFQTDLARPLKSLLIPFTPKQTGSGDPSPSNIRPIVPWEGLTVEHGGKNLLNVTPYGGVFFNVETGTDLAKTTSRATYTQNGNEITVTTESAWYGCVFATGVLPSGTYNVHTETSETNCKLSSYITDDDLIVKERKAITSNNITITLVEPSRIAVVISNQSTGSVVATNVQVESGSAFIAYEPYHPITETDISFPSPVYGGTLDVVSGVLTVEWAGFSATWGDGESATDMGEGITRKVYPMVDYLTTGLANNMCNIAPYQASENATVHFYYSGSGSTNRKCRLFLPSDTPDTTVVTVITKLSQTYEVQLTGQQITALIGNNTIWSDADGSMTAVYLKKG